MPICPEEGTSVLSFCDKGILTVTDDALMTKEHKQLLNDNRNDFVENMVPEDVLNLLVSSKVLSSRNVACVNREKGNTNVMNEHLLDILLHKPDRAFNEFVNALRNTDQDHVASLLVKRGETGVMRVELTSINSNYFQFIIHVYLPRIDTNKVQHIHKSLTDLYSVHIKLPNQ